MILTVTKCSRRGGTIASAQFTMEELPVSAVM